MMKWIKFISAVLVSYILGFTLNKGLSSTNVVRHPIDKSIEILKYDIPFIYTVGLNEMLVIILITVIILFIFYLYYSKDLISKIQVFLTGNHILKLECIIFSFIIGTWDNEINKFVNLNKYSLSIFVYTILIYGLLYIFSCENLEKNEYQNDLYESRVRLLQTIDTYLQNDIQTFSIIGEWGIGKTKLVKNFFYGSYDDNKKNKYRDKYEVIFIDASIYSDNKKIIEKLETELGEILFRYKILKLNKSFIGELFLNDTSFFIKLYTKFINNNFTVNEREILERKLQTLNLKNKKIVLCLDNLERLNNKERITSLFSIIDDVFPKQIKKIYLFDEKQMGNIFKKNEVDLKNYISKYTLNSINLRDIYIDEILVKNTSLNNKVKFLLDKIDLIIKNIDKEFEKNLKDWKKNHDISITEIKKMVVIKLKEIKEKYKKPRYLDDLKRYLEIFDKEEKESIYPLMYKILLENLTNVTFQEIFNDDKITLKKILEENIDIDEKLVEKICIYFLFMLTYEENGVDKEEKFKFKENEYYLLKMNFENLFFYRKNFKTELEKRLERYSENLNDNLFEALSTLKKIYQKNYSEEVKKYLNKNLTEEFIISTREKFIGLINIDGLEEFKELILPKTILNSNAVFLDGNERKTAKEYLKIMTNYYFLNNKYIRLGIELILSKEEFIRYKKIQLEELDEEINKIGGIEKIKSEILIKFDRYKEGLEKYFPEYLKNLNSIKTYEELLKIKEEKKEEKVTIKKINYKWFLIYGSEILTLIDEKGIKEIKLGDDYEYCLINKENISEYLNQLIEFRSNDIVEEMKKSVDTLIIYLIKKREDFNFN